ncbi:MAG: hypothetical protein COZ46_00060 [Verrucomicrobia bacterium CG_4_10_14_3_um_filter_43_23]|nr:MAG: hypothetical protein AUJ82_04875 [Verrucomicrobia bacterium CG1_02_43_26]PIP58973.1 MAG: hypothetical protein COX01_05325 [Verrucomicrobia bacterium CG22_combo_CG10-13_8_21_14_all_43_17]PIX59071.1 MAG: hypothetical protein COZ46_00060 [Verrucomicrobia bacterium CG_4_10_14_3_um_filter_43_23]PIY61407.1 MAG: hypothetical protein COY94_06050 [Verrucomicrobia bacterium CG_4_10_14_0_8_um_filter_43_34]PJA44698.1 MAG: hypothetical protein CO175_01590 [Verrucomicrobia bacterium CG_4_9_14_3_um_fi
MVIRVEQFQYYRANKWEKFAVGATVAGVVGAGQRWAAKMRPFAMNADIPLLGYVKPAILLINLATSFVWGYKFASSSLHIGRGPLQNPLKTLGLFAKPYLVSMDRHDFQLSALARGNASLALCEQFIQAINLSLVTAYYFCGFVFSPALLMTTQLAAVAIQDVYKWAYFFALCTIGVMKLHQFYYAPPPVVDFTVI